MSSLKRAPGSQFVAHVHTLPGNPYDGHTLVIRTWRRRSATGSNASSPIAGYRAQVYQAKFDEALKKSHG
jgi:hypothetical protein